MAARIELRDNPYIEQTPSSSLILALDELISGVYPKENAKGNIGVNFLLQRYPYPDQVLLDLSTSPELWTPRMKRQADNVVKAGRPKGEFKVLRKIQLDLSGKGNLQLGWRYLVVDLGMDLRPIRYASVPDHIYHVLAAAEKSGTRLW